MFGFIGEWLGIITGIVCAASIICALTPTPKDDAMIGKLYKAIELLALNIGKAKDKQIQGGCRRTFFVMIKPFVYNAILDRVVDGDTIDVHLDLGFSVFLNKQRVRLHGIDTPESRTRDLAEKKLGLAAKERLQ